MPIKINDSLPARELLENENIFVMTESRAASQDIRPLKILIVNLMPTKIVTETQLLRLMSNTPLQVDVEFRCCCRISEKGGGSDPAVPRSR